VENEETFWAGKLKRWPAIDAGQLDLPAEDREYLIQVGLPTGVDWNLQIDCRSAGDAPPLAGGSVILGYDGPIAIVADAHGGVFALEGGAKRFVNRSVSAFGKCLVAYEWYRRTVCDLDDDQAVATVREAASCFREADPDALMRDTYWTLVIEQMEAGLL
jgi:SUKH-4 immunity protein of toxin-antitoxin system